MEYWIGGAIVALLVAWWWWTHRPLVPSQLEPMSRHWLMSKSHHPLDTP